MNKNEAGRRVAILVGEDISTASNFEMIFNLNKYNLTLGAAEGVIRPDEDLVFTPEGDTEPVTYPANEYLYYVTKETDFPYSGEYSGRSHIEYSSPSLANFFGDLDFFLVGE